MVKLDTRVVPCGPQTVSADSVLAGHIVLYGPNRIAVMRTNQPPGGVPKTCQFIALQEHGMVSPVGTLLYFENETQLYPVTSAELIIKR